MRFLPAIGAALSALLLLAAMRTAGDMDYWHRYFVALGRDDPRPTAQQIKPRMKVAGEAPRAPARASAESEQIAPEALDEALAHAARQGARALIVHRHGHLVVAHFGEGVTAGTPIAGGDLSGVPMALALAAEADAGQLDAGEVRRWLQQPVPGAAGDWRNPWSGEARRHFAWQKQPAAAVPGDALLPQLVSQRVWTPLGAGDAAMGGDDPRAPHSCCFVAQLADWMRLADLLQQQGSHGGERIVSPQWIRELPVWMPASGWTGDEPPAANGTVWVDLEPDARLWLLPQRGLALLHWPREGSGLGPDTTLPNIIIRGMVDQAQLPSTTPLRDLVPEHAH